MEELACDPTRSDGTNDICYPLESWHDQSWSLGEIFGRPIHGACPLTELEGYGAETVCLEVPDERDVLISAGGKEHKYESGYLRCYILPGIPHSLQFRLLLTKGFRESGFRHDASTATAKQRISI